MIKACFYSINANQILLFVEHNSRNPNSLRNEERGDEVKGSVLKKEIDLNASQIEKTRKCTAHEDEITEQNHLKVG